MRAAEKRHMDAVATVGCVLCKHLGFGPTPPELHHVKEGMGIGQRNSNFLVVPLCPEHHRGKTGLHGLGTRGFEAAYKLSELDLLAMTLEEMAR